MATNGVFLIKSWAQKHAQHYLNSLSQWWTENLSPHQKSIGHSTSLRRRALHAEAGSFALETVAGRDI